MKFTHFEVVEAQRSLTKILRPGDTIYVVQRNASRSSANRDLSLFKIDSKSQIRDITFLAIKAMGKSPSRNGTLRVDGSDFEAVHALGRTLWPRGHRCLGPKKCPSNDHVNESTPDYAKSRIHRDGGYALNVKAI